ncbi:MAG: EamA family transporter [Thermodesulfobacteriota bacterium]
MKKLDLLIAISITIIWGSAFAIIELGLKDFPPIFNASLRFLVAAVPLVFFIKRPKVSLKFLILFGSNYVAMFSLMYVGIKIGMPAGLTSLVLQTAVLFAVILSALVLKEKPSPGQITGIFLGVLGVGIIGSDSSNFGSFLSFSLVLGAAFFYGSSSILMKSADKVDFFSLIIWACLVPPLPLFILSLILETGHWQAVVNFSAMAWISILYTGLLGTVVAFATWGWLLKKYTANHVEPFKLLVPVVGMITSHLLTGENFSIKVLCAFLFILVGLFCITFENKIIEYFSRSQSALLVKKDTCIDNARGNS